MNPKYYIKHMENIGLISPQTDGSTRYALDLGCGKGGDSRYLSYLGYEVTSVDEEAHYEKALVADIRSFDISPAHYSIIICNNVLPFIQDKKDVEAIIHRIIQGLKEGGVAFFTLYGPHSGFKDRTDMSFFEYSKALAIVESQPVEIMDKTTSEGYTKNGRGEVIYQHSHRFIIRKKTKK